MNDQIIIITSANWSGTVIILLIVIIIIITSAH